MDVSSCKLSPGRVEVTRDGIRCVYARITPDGTLLPAGTWQRRVIVDGVAEHTSYVFAADVAVVVRDAVAQMVGREAVPS